jgi:hypothetical protein
MAGTLDPQERSTMGVMDPSRPQEDERPPSATDIGYDPSKPVMTVGDLLASEVAGMWKHRTDIGDSVEFARRLREGGDSKRK